LQVELNTAIKPDVAIASIDRNASALQLCPGLGFSN
jgi:hypothetical protein